MEINKIALGELKESGAPRKPDGAVAPPGCAALVRQGFITWVVYIQVGYPVGELRASRGLSDMTVALYSWGRGPV
eukprot:COSAG04_NODE_12616_length_644_cov_1.454044_1_plen_75_part_00